MLPTAEHSGARTSWVAYSRQARRSTSPQELSIQTFTLYRLRFLFAAELCQAFDKFGGLALQLSHLSTIHNLPILESAGVALDYHRALTGKLMKRALQRSDQLSDFTILLAIGDFTIKEQARRREISAAVDKDKRDQQTSRGQAQRIRQTQNPTRPPPVMRNGNRQQADNARNRSRSRTPARSPGRDRVQPVNRTQNLPQNARNQTHRYGFPQRPANPPPLGQRGNQQRHLVIIGHKLKFHSFDTPPLLHSYLSSECRNQ